MKKCRSRVRKRLETGPQSHSTLGGGCLLSFDTLCDLYTPVDMSMPHLLSFVGSAQTAVSEAASFVGRVGSSESSTVSAAPDSNMSPCTTQTLMKPTHCITRHVASHAIYTTFVPPPTHAPFLPPPTPLPNTQTHSPLPPSHLQGYAKTVGSMAWVGLAMPHTVRTNQENGRSTGDVAIVQRYVDAPVRV